MRSSNDTERWDKKRNIDDSDQIHVLSSNLFYMYLALVTKNLNILT